MKKLKKLLIKTFLLLAMICFTVNTFIACGGGNNGNNGGDTGGEGTTTSVNKIEASLLDGKIANFLGAEGFGLLDKNANAKSSGVEPLSKVSKIEPFSLNVELYDEEVKTQKENEFTKHTTDGRFMDVHFHNADVSLRKMSYKDLNKKYDKHHHKGELCGKTSCEDLSDEIEADEQNGVSNTVLSLGARVNKLYNSEKFTFISISSAVEGKVTVKGERSSPIVDQGKLMQLSSSLPTAINIENHYSEDGGFWMYNLIEVSNKNGKGYIPIKTNTNEVGYHTANYWSDDYNQSYIIDNKTGMTYSLSQFKYIYSVENGVIKVFNKEAKGWFDYYTPNISEEGISFDKVVFPQDEDFNIGIGSNSGVLIDKFSNIVVANSFIFNGEMDEYGEKKYGDNIILSYNSSQVLNEIMNGTPDREYADLFSIRYRLAKRYHKGSDDRIYRVDFRGNLSNVKVHVLSENCTWEEVSQDTTVTFENNQGYIRWMIGRGSQYFDCFRLNRISNGNAFYSTASLTDGGKVWDSLCIYGNLENAIQFGEYVGVVKISVNGPDEENSHLSFMKELQVEGFSFRDNYKFFLVGDTQMLFWREGKVHLWDIEKNIKKKIVVEGAKIVGLTNDNLCFNNLGYFSLVKEVEIENFSENSFSSKPIKIGGELDAYFKLVVGALN